MAKKVGSPGRRGRPPKGGPPAPTPYILYAKIDPDLGEQFDKLLGRTRRSIKAEVELMMEAWLSQEGLWPKS